MSAAVNIWSNRICNGSASWCNASNLTTVILTDGLVPITTPETNSERHPIGWPLPPASHDCNSHSVLSICAYSFGSVASINVSAVPISEEIAGSTVIFPYFIFLFSLSDSICLIRQLDTRLLVECPQPY